VTASTAEVRFSNHPGRSRPFPRRRLKSRTSGAKALVSGSACGTAKPVPFVSSTQLGNLLPFKQQPINRSSLMLSQVFSTLNKAQGTGI
jgi:hypothetical protein